MTGGHTPAVTGVRSVGVPADFRHQVAVVRRRKWAIMLPAVAVVAGAVLVSLRMDPVYRATARVLPPQGTSASVFGSMSGGDPNRNLMNEMQSLTSKPVRDAVTAKLGSAPPIRVAPVVDTDVLLVSADSTDPRAAAATANTYAAAFIAVRRQQQSDALQALTVQLRSKVNALQGRIDALRQQIAAAPTADQGAVDRGVATELASNITQKAGYEDRLDQIQLQGSLDATEVRVVDDAAVPSAPISPSLWRNAAVAVLVGLILGLMVGFLAEYLDDEIKSKSDVQRLAPELPVLGLIPPVSAPRGSTGWLTAPADSHAPWAEAYRIVRTSVEFLGLQQNLRVIQVTSPGADEGKTMTAANLAVALSRSGYRVIVLGCDLRRPRLHEVFGLSNEVGMTSVLSGTVRLEQALQTVDSEVGLAVLPSGPSCRDPSEMLGGTRMTALLQTMRGQADIILLDSAPVLPVADAVALSGKADANIFVVRAGVTRGRSLSQSLERFAQVSAPIIGLVLNGADPKHSYGFSYSYPYTEQPAGGGNGLGPALSGSDPPARATVAASPPARKGSNGSSAA